MALHSPPGAYSPERQPVRLVSAAVVSIVEGLVGGVVGRRVVEGGEGVPLKEERIVRIESHGVVLDDPVEGAVLGRRRDRMVLAQFQEVGFVGDARLEDAVLDELEPRGMVCCLRSLAVGCRGVGGFCHMPHQEPYRQCDAHGRQTEPGKLLDPLATRPPPRSVKGVDVVVAPPLVPSVEITINVVHRDFLHNLDGLVVLRLLLLLLLPSQ
mmetsp:Transcript_40140/g.74204  ORF Transcript_40140/g.74204 Transcript_40140/m.74204 type:complete len:211 (+) Transcript_40140:1470-2102(+)